MTTPNRDALMAEEAGVRKEIHSEINSRMLIVVAYRDSRLEAPLVEQVARGDFGGKDEVEIACARLIERRTEALRVAAAKEKSEPLTATEFSQRLKDFGMRRGRMMNPESLLLGKEKPVVVADCCKLCRFCRTDGEDDGGGRCHRYPPSVNQNKDDVFEWPSVHLDVDWCGEFKKAVKP